MATVVAETKICKVSGGEESSTERGANGSSFLVGIIRTAGNMVACSNQLSSGTVLLGVLTEKVRGEEIKCMSFKIISIVNSWRNQHEFGQKA